MNDYCKQIAPCLYIPSPINFTEFFGQLFVYQVYVDVTIM